MNDDCDKDILNYLQIHDTLHISHRYSNVTVDMKAYEEGRSVRKMDTLATAVLRDEPTTSTPRIETSRDQAKGSEHQP